MRATKEIDFDDFELPQLEFKTEGIQKNPMRNVKLQTSEIQMKTQTTNTQRAGRTVKLQVEDKQISMAYQTTGTGTDAQTEDDQEQNEIQEQKLLPFLKYATPLVMEALSENIATLQNYEPLWQNQRKNNEIIYTLSNKNNKSNETINNLDITSISWSCNGFTLAASYGNFNHSGSCEDKSMVCTWNLNKRYFQQDEPSLIIETENCIMTLEYHPTKPSILVGGSFNGEIYLWDTSKEDENLLSKSSIDDYFHRECISQFIWFENRLRGQINSIYNLLSISTDGKILLWETKDDFQPSCLQAPIKGFSLVRKKDGAVAFVGGLSFAQALEDKNTFIIGSEAGSILRGTLRNINYDNRNKTIIDQNTGITWKSNTTPFMLNVENKFVLDLKQQIEKGCKQRDYKEIDLQNIFQVKPDMRKLYINPITFAFEQHLGPVYSISFSPFHRNLFLSCSLDGSIRLYDLLSPKPLISIDDVSNYVFKVEWSQTRPSVFSAVLSNGEIRIYDLIQSKNKPIFVIENQIMDQQALNLKINKKQTDLMAVAFQKCQIRIIQLADSVCLPKKNEIETLTQIVDDIKGN